MNVSPVSGNRAGPLTASRVYWPIFYTFLSYAASRGCGAFLF